MIYKSVENLKKAFIGELVVVFIKGMDVAIVSEDGKSMNISSMVEGYFVDVDEDYIYLANNFEGPIKRSISHDIAKMIQIAPTEEEQMLEMLYETGSNFGDNEDDGDFH